MLQFPAPVAKSAYVADGAHGHIHQAARIRKWLSFGLRLDDAFNNLGGRFVSLLSVRVSRIGATDPVEAGIEQHLLHVGPAMQSARKATRRAKTRRRNPQAGLHRGCAEVHIITDYLRRS